MQMMTLLFKFTSSVTCHFVLVAPVGSGRVGRLSWQLLAIGSCATHTLSTLARNQFLPRYTNGQDDGGEGPGRTAPGRTYVHGSRRNYWPSLGCSWKTHGFGRRPAAEVEQLENFAAYVCNQSARDCHVHRTLPMYPRNISRPLGQGVEGRRRSPALAHCRGRRPSGKSSSSPRCAREGLWVWLGLAAELAGGTSVMAGSRKL